MKTANPIEAKLKEGWHKVDGQYAFVQKLGGVWNYQPMGGGRWTEFDEVKTATFVKEEDVPTPPSQWNDGMNLADEVIAASLHWTGEDEEKNPGLKKIRTLAGHMLEQWRHDA